LISITYKNAKTQANGQDEYFYKNNGKFIGKLHCVPILVNDNIDVNGVGTTGGLKALRNSVPNQDTLLM
jgi:Asp-tRNA(Asn)/Glu-tRNA(Gln) amidotransferase A subunit family amidase